MKANIVTFAGAGALIVAVLIGFAIVRPVLAQVAVTSTDSTAPPTPPADTVASSTPSDTSSTLPVESASSSASPVQTTPADSSTAAARSPGSAATVTAAQKPLTEPPPAGLTEVHIIGTKYTDYFTDGSITIAVLGDPTIAGNFDKPDAPIPTHDGMTWVHTTGQNLYDTPSGDLEVGDYAVQSNGSYLTNPPPFVSSTSTAAQLPASMPGDTEASTSSSTTSLAFPSVPGASTSTAITSSESSTSTTTPSEPTTSLAI